MDREEAGASGLDEAAVQQVGCAVTSVCVGLVGIDTTQAKREPAQSGCIRHGAAAGLAGDECRPRHAPRIHLDCQQTVVYSALYPGKAG